MSPFAALDGRLTAVPDGGRVSFLLARDFAHRGLWGGDVPENSLAAARVAIEAGFGIECDVRLSQDGIPIVFHDADLARLCGRDDRLRDMTAETLSAVTFIGSTERVPRLADLLRLIAGRAGLLVEIKIDMLAETVPLCLAVRRALEGYRGPVAVMSFNPEVSRWFARHAPAIVRGLVMTEKGGALDPLKRRLAVWRAKPEFVAYDIRHLPSPLMQALRRQRIPVLTWTPRTEAERQRAGEHADRAIFERAEAA